MGELSQDTGTKLNIGCGEDTLEDYVNIDIRNVDGVDMVRDVTDLPLPFKDESIIEIKAIDIVEHLLKVVPFIDECGRILVKGGILAIRTSYWKSENAFTDPTHHHYFTLNSFDYWDPTTKIGREYGYYTDAKFNVMNAQKDGQELVFTLRKRSYKGE